MRGLLEVVGKRVTKAKLSEVVDKADAALKDALRRLNDTQLEVQRLEEHNRRLVTDVNFWMEQSRHYANQNQQAWEAHAKLLKQMSAQSVNPEFKEYTAAVARLAAELAPRPAEIAACIAMSGRDTQGISAVGFDPNKQKLLKGGTDVIDVEDEQ